MSPGRLDGNRNGEGRLSSPQPFLPRRELADSSLGSMRTSRAPGGMPFGLGLVGEMELLADGAV